MNITQTLLPIVALYTADEPSVTAVREYFSQNGCQVFVNKKISDEVAYSIVIGDENFVKYILANVPLKGSKVLLWMWSENRSVPEEILKHGYKIFLSGYVSMDHSMLAEALEFFFISKHTTYIHSSVAPIHETVMKPIPVLEKMETVPVAETEKRLQEVAPTYPHENSRTTPVVDNPMTRQTINRLFTQNQNMSRTEKNSSASEHIHHTYVTNNSPVPSPFSRSIDQQRIKKTIADLYATPKKDHSIIPKKILTYVGYSVLLACIYISTLGIQTIILIRHIKGLATCITNADTVCIKKSGELVTIDHTALMTTSGLMIAGIGMFSNEAAYDIENISKLIAHVGKIAGNVAGAADEGLLLAKNVGNSSPDDPTASPIVGVVRLKKTVELLRAQSSDIKQLTSSLVLSTGPVASLGKIRSAILSADTMIDRANRLLESGNNLLTLAPLIGGFRQPQRYLVLLQNSAELRPTGGFIGSIIKLTIDNGRITTKDVSDVYTLDGQLKGHVDPPEPIRSLLGQEHWYLRDSNWSPDFATSAKQAVWFYQKEQGSEDPIDGVIGMTTESVRKYLSESGPLDLPDIRDRITGQNFYDKAYVHTEKGFFPGSTQKRDFLTSLSDALMIRLTQGSKGDAHAAVLTLFEGLASSDINLWFPDVEKQHLIETYGWAGQIPILTSCSEKTSKTAPCTLLSTPINEANMGVSKINTRISREDTWHIDIGTGGILNETLTRVIENTADRATDGGGYLTYLRFYIPQASIGTTVTIDGKQINRRIKSDETVQIPYWEFADTLGDKIAIGVAVKIPAKSTSVTSVTFTHENPLALGPDGGLVELSIPRQQGIGATKTTVSVTYPSEYRPRSFQMERSALLANPGRLEYNTLLSEPKHIYIRLGRLYE